ncbi:NUDIX domain-containing protein [Microlunatus sp. Gsoil 973]|uniref:NUDIX hydrolase n=1 Tax=Microlunatus sp. Gsoil 973 TaxID=2672569 RepID=UPI0012B44B62|nr:NUDIX domain-containing protein [Microlunatus sp. Gsoil 973]QGN33368.1 NUDIX domain-containing protein [Microlunatus sp. Gsoil 973]
MPTPQFIIDLREHIGTTTLLLPGVRSVVFDDAHQPSRVLLAKRADNGQWHLPAGIMEPDEQPAPALVREVLEETGVEIAIDRLVSLVTLPTATYPNGDQVQFLSATFRGHYLSGEAHVADDESTDVGWFAIDQLPDGLYEKDRETISFALPVEAPPYFAV